GQYFFRPGANDFTGTLSFDAMSANRAYSFPDWSGAIAVATSTLQVSSITSTTTATSTFQGGIQAPRFNGTTASSTLNGLNLTNILGCSQALETDAVGGIICGTDATGAGTVWPWDIVSYQGTTTNSTTTKEWFKLGLFASS